LIAATVATAVCDTKTHRPAPILQARKASSIASVPLAQADVASDTDEIGKGGLEGLGFSTKV
jgi:hypothetical protein